jgi:hypothetical protein
MGGPGCALASTLISWMWCCPDWRSCCAVRRTGPLEIFTRWEWPRWDRIQPLLRLGVPMGLTYLIEITSFTLMSIFITHGHGYAAGHQIIANLSAVAYMMPLSLSIATSTLVRSRSAHAIWPPRGVSAGAASAWAPDSPTDRHAALAAARAAAACLCQGSGRVAKHCR